MNRSILLLLFPLLSLASLVTAAGADRQFVPDLVLKQDDITVLMAVDARRSPGLEPWQPGGHGKFFVTGWSDARQQVEWTVTNPEAAEQEAALLVRTQDARALRVEITAAGRTVSGNVPVKPGQWQRVSVEGRLPLPAGESAVTLRLLPADGADGFRAEVHALELARPGVRAELERRAAALRADTEWFRRARYGIMVHWTDQSMPRHGERLPYAEAVKAFDVARFAEQMQSTGAGFVVFTTSHAHQVFPAPLKSLDRILPGRTTERDLVAELADALRERGMKLFLYYHLGSQQDPEWLDATGFWDTDTTALFRHWQAIVGEAGERYGDRLAGWWFDDGSTGYYYRSPPWEALARAAKTGHAGRLITFNAWELANPTAFHDFSAGEGCEHPGGVDGLLPPNAGGRYPSGSHAGLQASACLVTESAWVHHRRDAAPAPPKWTVDQLTERLHRFIAHENVPIFNFEITQDGLIGEETLALFREAARRLGETPPAHSREVGRP